MHLETILSGEEKSKLRCIYHGLDMSHYEPRARSVSDYPLLLSVGQLKEKKGFPYLLEACRLLQDWGYSTV